MSTLRLVTQDETLRILRSKNFSIMVYISVMVGVVFFGFMFIFVIKGSRVPSFLQYTGYLMLAVSLVLLIRLPRYVVKLNRAGGDFIFEADRQGIRVVPDRLQGTTMWDSPLSVVELPWEDVKRMVCGKWLVQKTIKKTSTYGRMVIFVEPPEASTVERLYKFSEKAPDGSNIIVIPFAAEHFSRFRLEVERLSQGRVVPEMFEHIVFDYKSQEVLYKVEGR